VQKGTSGRGSRSTRPDRPARYERLYPFQRPPEPGNGDGDDAGHARVRADLWGLPGPVPRRARQIDHCAAPHPGSSTSLPATSPSTCRSSSGIAQILQVHSGVFSCAACHAWDASLAASR